MSKGSVSRELAGVAFDSNGGASGAMGIDTVSLPNENGFFNGVAIGNFANEMSSLYVATEAPFQFFDAAIATGLGPATRSNLTFGFASS